MALLISVRDADESMAALAGGADLIDVKEPANGPLGRADDAVIESIIRTVDGRAPLSSAGGELHHDGAHGLPAGLAFVKFGLAGWRNRDWPGVWREAPTSPAARMPARRGRLCRLANLRSPPPEEIAAFAVAERFGAFLIDTFEKNGATLLDVVPMQTIAELTSRCQAAGVPVALAGSLGINEIVRLQDVNPDWFAGARFGLPSGARQFYLRGPGSGIERPRTSKR